MKNYGSAIKKLRRNADITQAQLAEKLNVSSQTVSKWENGVNLPDILALEEMCSLFGVTMEEFLRLADGGELKTCAPAQPEPTVTAAPVVSAVTASPAPAPHAQRKIKPWVIILIVAVVTLYVVSAVVGIVLTVTRNPFGWFKRPSSGGGKGIYEKVNPSVFCITVQTENDTLGGSGFFIDSNGTAVTNYHVIEGIRSAKVKLYDGKEYDVDRILGHDTVRDVAIIHVNATWTSPVKLADSNSISTGSTVYAIGYPESFVLGSLDSTMTDGIISKTSYTLGGVNYIQSTVDITHGNSGGVLINTDGEVIGITTAGIDLGNVTYMNLSVPSNVIKSVKRDINLSVENYAAKYSKKITVTYMLDGSVYARKTVCAAESVPCLTVDLTGLGEKYFDCEFLGWFADDKYSVKFDFEAEVVGDENFTLYAKLRFKETDIVYTGGSGAVGTMRGETVKADESFTLSENSFIRTGYKFVSWEINGKSYAAGDKVVVDGSVRELSVKAEWTGISYTAMFSFEGQSVEKNYVYGVAHSLPGAVYERTGYNQTGWTYKGKTYALNQIISDGLTTVDDAVITVTPAWTPIKYRLKLDLGKIADFEGKEYRAGHYAYITGTYGENPFAAHSDPESGGLVFEGWTVYSADGSIYEGDLRFVNPDPNVVVSAKAEWVSGRYAIALYKSRFGYDDALGVLVLEGREERVLPLYSTFDDEGYSLGFHLDHWIMYNNDRTQEELTFKDGATVSDLMVHYYYMGFRYDYEYDVDYFLDFYADFEPNSYTLHFEGGGAQGSMESLDCLYNQKVTLPANAFTKEGYTFAGWQFGDSIFKDESVIEELTTEDGGEVTLTARWLKSFEGEGTAEEPYEISSYEQLKNVSDAVEHINGYRSAHYRLTSDIDCDGGELTAIGYNKSFSGVFDGNGHVIKNAVFAATSGRKGLFYRVYGGQILNAGLKDYVIDGTDNCNYFAPLVCEYTSDLPLQNCFAEGTISWQDDYGYFAGLVYTLCGRAVNCYSVCTFNMEYTHSASTGNILYIGGFLGRVYGAGQNWDGETYCTVTQSLAENCYADAHINVSVASSVTYGYSHYTGLFSAFEGKYKNCFATGEITYDCGYDFIASIRSGVRLFSGNIYFNTYDNVYVADSAKIKFTDREITDINSTIQKTADDNLCSLEWLKENAEFDDNVWQENAGALPTLKAFAS